MREKLRKVIQGIWEGKRKIPEDCKTGIICSVFKKDNKEETTNYRRVTLMDTAYKIYAFISEERLRKETERLEIIPETQAGFRKGRSCMDNVFALKTVIEKTIAKKSGKLLCGLEGGI